MHFWDHLVTKKENHGWLELPWMIQVSWGGQVEFKMETCADVAVIPLSMLHFSVIKLQSRPPVDSCLVQVRPQVKCFSGVLQHGD